MEVKDMISKLWSPKDQGVPTMTHPFAGVTPEPVVSKNNAFDPTILNQAQKSFGQPTPAGQNPNQAPTKGTVGNLIPPGWSSQAKEG